MLIYSVDIEYQHSECSVSAVVRPYARVGVLPCRPRVPPPGFSGLSGPKPTVPTQGLRPWVCTGF